jgi:hypothetical protein
LYTLSTTFTRVLPPPPPEFKAPTRKQRRDAKAHNHPRAKKIHFFFIKEKHYSFIESYAKKRKEE